MIGTGMSLTAAPATTAIVTALPVEKAGIGSAVNDTTREVGTALGIAVFGSVVNAAYRSRLDLAGLGLLVELRAADEDSIGGANTVAHRTPVGDALTQRAAAAFADAFSLANSISVAVVLTTAAAVVALHRRNRRPSTLRRPGAGASSELVAAVSSAARGE